MPLLATPFAPLPASNFLGLPDLPAIAELRTRPNWVAWKYENRNGRLTKPPVSPKTGYGASHSAPGTWGTYEQAVARAEQEHLPGVGYVMTDHDGLTGADLDKCRDAVTGSLEPWAADVLALKETYAEISPSGTGIRMIWRGKVESTTKCDPAHVEIYRSLRYLTITGDHLAGVPDDIRPAPETLAKLLARVASFKAPAQALAAATTTSPDFFRTLNTRALARLSDWVFALFPGAGFQFATGAYRVTSKQLGRDLEEDLSIAPNGIVDFGVHDLGDARHGKRTPIDLVLHYGGHASPKDAAFWLCDRLRLRPDDLGWRGLPSADANAAISQVNLAALARSEPEPPMRQPLMDTAELEDLRFDGNPYLPEAIGGLLGLVARHILDTALFPVPDFACLSACVLGSALYGRRFSEPLMGGGLNIYAIGTAPTGWGKDHPLQEPAQIAYRCEMMHLMGPSEFKSDSAIEKTLRKNPVRACYMDEIGLILQANASRNASVWERRIRKALLQVYSSSRGMWTGSQAAGDEGDKATDPIHRPVLSIYGTSTPEELYKGLTEDNVRDGLFGRLIFAAPDEKPKRRAKVSAGYLDEIKLQVDAVRSTTPAGVPERQRALYHANLRNALIPPAQIQVPATSDAIAAIELILGWQRDLTERELELASIANRAGENVGKLATLRALSRDCETPEVSYQDVQWAWSIVERSLIVIARDIDRHMVGSDFEGLVKAIRRHVQDAGKEGLSISRLNDARGVSKAHQRDRESAIRQLIESGDLAKERTGNRGFRMVWTGPKRG